MYLLAHSGQREIKMGERVMDGRLLEAGMGGNKETLLKLLQEDPLILDRVKSECKGNENPLHVGVMHGEVEFVKEILSRNPEFTRELNSQGQSPLHLASARGHVEVVKEILSRDDDASLTRELNSKGQSPLHLAFERGHVDVVKEILSKDADACFIRNQDGMIPLHLAAIKGRVEVLEELVNANWTTVFLLTESEDPVLHLCATNYKFRALTKLIELVKDDPYCVNMKDRDGNTILHLLSAMENLEVIKILVKTPGVDVNAENIDGFTPLDVSLEIGNIFPGFTIRRLLTEAGAKGNVIKSSLVILIKKTIMLRNNGSRFAEALLVVAILIATVAFQARLNPPGGVWQDSGCHNATVPNAPKSSPTSPNALQCSQPNATLPNATMLHYHSAGQSIMSYMDSSSYVEFSASNDSMLAYSLLAIQLLLLGYIFNSSFFNLLAIPFIFTSFLFMSFTYNASVTFISLEKKDLLSGSLVVFSSAAWICICLVGQLLALLLIFIDKVKSWKTLVL